MDDFREAVTIAAGFCHDQKQIDGSFTKRANSISFAQMDQAQFEEVHNKVLTVCLKILGIKGEDFERELLNYA